MVTRTLRVSVVGHREDGSPVAVDISWPDDFASSLPAAYSGIEAEDKAHKDVVLWSGATFPTGARRKNETVEGVCALVLDYDGKHGAFTLDDILSKWQGYDLVAHSTYQHTPDKPRYRVILPLSRVVTPAEYAGVWAWAQARDPRIDPSCKNASRFFYWPTHRLDVEPVYVYCPGQPLDPGSIPSLTATMGHGLSGGPSHAILNRPLPPRTHEVAQVDHSVWSRGAAADVKESPFAKVGEVPQREDFTRIFERCRFIEHATLNAPDLSYDEWTGALSIVARCAGGDNLAHAISQPHPGYDADETEAKYQWVKGSGPRTCAFLRDASPACQGCTLPEDLRITSPIQLGVPVSPAQATATPLRIALPALAAEDPDAVRASVDEARERVQASRVAHDDAARAQAKTQRALGLARRGVASEADLERDMQADLDAKAEVREKRAALRRAETVLDRLEMGLATAGLPTGADPKVWAKLRLTAPDGVPKPADTVANVHTIFEEDPRWSARLSFNDFSHELYLDGKSVKDPQVTELVTCLARDYTLDTSSPRVWECLALVASRRTFHPVREYLAGLTWDGTARLDTMLFDGFGVEAGDDFDDVIRILSSRFLLSVVARVMDPGCQVDTVLVLQGGQGFGKSQALGALVPNKGWFSRTELNIGDKDAYMQLQGVWLYEIAEMHAIGRKDVDKAKAWLSSAEDRYRAPYARAVQAHPRQVVFVWTVNPEQYLTDPTGSRRYWPVRCVNTLDRAWIAENRDALFAEAYARYGAGEKWWFDTGSLEADRLAEMSGDHVVRHPWHGIVARWLITNRPTDFTVEDLLTRCFSKMVGDIKPQDAATVGKILSDLECPARNTSIGGVKGKYYTMSEALLAAAPGVREVKTNPFVRGVDVPTTAK